MRINTRMNGAIIANCKIFIISSCFDSWSRFHMNLYIRTTRSRIFARECKFNKIIINGSSLIWIRKLTDRSRCKNEQIPLYETIAGININGSRNSSKSKKKNIETDLLGREWIWVGWFWWIAGVLDDLFKQI